jgi:hypothetical protein
MAPRDPRDARDRLPAKAGELRAAEEVGVLCGGAGLRGSWYERRWALLRRVHLAARPGAVRDLRLRRGALAGCGPRGARVERDEFVASVTGMLGLGSLVRGTGRVGPLLCALFTACAGVEQRAGTGELECAASRETCVDLRELVGGLFILESAGAGAGKLLRELFALFDERGSGWLVAWELERLLALLSPDAEWAARLGGLAAGLPGARVGFDALLARDRAVSAAGESVLCDAMLHCLAFDERLRVEQTRRLKELRAASEHADLAQARLVVHRMLTLRLRLFFDRWSVAAETQARMRRGGAAGEAWRRRGLLLAAVARLDDWRLARQRRRRGAARARAFYRALLLRRCFGRLRKLHAFHATVRAVSLRVRAPALARGAALLEAALVRGARRRAAQAVRDALLLWRGVNARHSALLATADRFRLRRALGAPWRCWRAAAAAARRERLAEHERARAQAFLGAVACEAHEEAARTEEARRAETAAAQRDERRARKYQASLSRQSAALRRRAERRAVDEALAARQRERRRERYERERAQHAAMREVELLRLFDSMRAWAAEELSSKEAEADLLRIARDVRALLMLRTEELPVDSEELLGKYGGAAATALPRSQRARCVGLYLERKRAALERLEAKALRADKPFNFDAQLVDDRLVLEARRQAEVISTRAQPVGLPAASFLVLVRLRDRFDCSGLPPPDKLVAEDLVRWQVVEGMVAAALPRIEAQADAHVRAALEAHAAQVVQRAWSGSRRRKATLRLAAQRRALRLDLSATSLQTWWRAVCARARLRARLEDEVYRRVDPASGADYYICALDGAWSWQRPRLARRRFPGLEFARDGLNADWFVLRDPASGQPFYKSRLLGQAAWSLPAGATSCSACRVEIAERRCLSCRFVEQGDVVAPALCIPCWVQGGQHCRHRWQPA